MELDCERVRALLALDRQQQQVRALLRNDLQGLQFKWKQPLDGTAESRFHRPLVSMSSSDQSSYRLLCNLEPTIWVAEDYQDGYAFFHGA